METFLFNEMIFGPVTSRRLGNSLGINLLPIDSKLCNFNCLYCECGLTESNCAHNHSKLPTRETIRTELQKKLEEYKKLNQPIDTITFAGNGEPTLHPDFPLIIDDTIELRDKYFQSIDIAVLSNATRINKQEVAQALLKVDQNILKLDSAYEDTIQKINCPLGQFSLEALLDGLTKFEGNLTIQTLFVKGEYEGYAFDNTTDKEIEAWLKVLKQLRPKQVMIYTIARNTPITSVKKIPGDTLRSIAEKVEQLNIPVIVSE